MRMSFNLFKLLLLVLSLMSLPSIRAQEYFKHIDVQWDFDKEKFTSNKPHTYAPRGILMLLKPKSAPSTLFTLYAGGLITNKDAFKNECKKSHNEYRLLGGRISKLKMNSNTCQFNRVFAQTKDQIRLAFFPQKNTYIGLMVVHPTDNNPKKLYEELWEGISFE